MKIYIAGPITGTPDYKDTFSQAEKDLQHRGYMVMNPTVLPEGFEHEEYMRICYAMVDVCDAVYMLPNWERSKGAQLEFLYAQEEGKLVVTEFTK